MNWGVAKEIAGTIQNLVATVAIIGGAIWAYFKFVRYRELKPKLEFSFDWSCSADGKGGWIAILTLRMLNKGKTKVDLRVDEAHQCLLKYNKIGDVGENAT